MIFNSKGLATLVASLAMGCSANVVRTEEPKISESHHEIAGPEIIEANYRLNVRNKDPVEIERILSTIERVPDPIQKIVNDYGAIVVIFDGLITDNESVSSWKGKQIPKWSEGKTYDILPGVYSVGYKEVLIMQNPPPKSHGSISLAEHEYGHAVDHALGNVLNLHEISSGTYFSQVHQISRTYLKPDGSLRISTYGYNYMDEFFAESFAKFYSSDETKIQLKNNFPEVYVFMKTLEMKTAEGSLTDFNKLDDGSYEPDSVKYKEWYAPQGRCVIH